MNGSLNEWYTVDSIPAINSPALLLYHDRVLENIRMAITIAGDVNRLRPHVKTNKIAEVCTMMMKEGIRKFKCATIAEAEMLGLVRAEDVLIAYQPVGPSLHRLVELIKTYPATDYSCLVDNAGTATALSEAAVQEHIQITVFIDLNTGMNRTGVHAAQAFPLVEFLLNLPGIVWKGLHVYDGHIQEVNGLQRQKKSDEGFREVDFLALKINKELERTPVIVAGGSATFPTHLKRKNVECSPGTFVFWDHGNKMRIPDQPFNYAALVITRIISIIDEKTVCTDMGYKAVASESPLPRVFFLNLPDAVSLNQSEEHLVVQVENTSSLTIGDVLYAVPMHICPTVALYKNALVIKNKEVVEQWNVIARDRRINI